MVKSAGVSGKWQGILLLSLFLAVGVLEFYGKIFERGIGHYLKWQNHKRPQLGRIWERDRQALVAQAKIQSIRSVLDLQENSAESIQTFKQLFEQVEPAFPLVVTRKKFLELYFDFPGPWSERIISSYELLQIDAEKTWDRVFLKRFGPWITIGFLDLQGVPLREVFLSVDALFEVQSTRTIKRGRLEEMGFTEALIFSRDQVVSIVQTLDPKTQKTVFPEPRWFLGKDYHVTRVGVSDEVSNSENHMVFGIEYSTDYYIGVLLIPVPLDIAYNMLSQLEKTEGDYSTGDLTSLAIPSGGTF
ncbi:MAG: hypothetical protein NPINA01_28680 [Nitrospinaceae bacterium]|nr:MAG: hypothetical protein NPINA01_28680 [Nitrospinaceae bacterium]